VLDKLCEVVKESRPQLEWILEQQATLRRKYLDFNRLELKAIASSVHDASRVSGTQPADNLRLVQTIRSDFRHQLEFSFNVLAPGMRHSDVLESLARHKESLNEAAAERRLLEGSPCSRCGNALGSLTASGTVTFHFWHAACVSPPGTPDGNDRN